MNLLYGLIHVDLIKDMIKAEDPYKLKRVINYSTTKN
jgi:hypothetical protein